MTCFPAVAGGAPPPCTGCLSISVCRSHGPARRHCSRLLQVSLGCYVDSVPFVPPLLDVLLFVLGAFCATLVVSSFVLNSPVSSGAPLFARLRFAHASVRFRVRVSVIKPLESEVSTSLPVRLNGCSVRVCAWRIFALFLVSMFVCVFARPRRLGCTFNSGVSLAVLNQRL